MSKVTTKFQVTVPKTVVKHYGIRPGDDMDWVPAGDVIRVIPSGLKVTGLNPEVRLHLFDQATARQSRRQRGWPRTRPARGRGWKREDLYLRGRSR